MEFRHFHAVTGIALAVTLTFAPAAKAEDVIKIGAPLALTGPLSAEAKKQQTVWDMWLAKVNSSGGIKVGSKKMRVELVKYDYQSDGPRSAQLAEKLLTDDKVNFLLAPFGSGHTKIVATVAERYQTPVIACASSAESVFNQGFKNLFGTLSPNGGMTDAMVAFFKSKMPQLHRVAVLGRDDVFPKSMAEGISDAAKKGSLDVVYDKLYPVGTMDQSSAMSAIKESKPDWIYVSGYTQDLILARKQMADLSVSAPIVTMVTGPAYKEFTEGLGDLANDITSSSWWHHATSYQGVGPWPTTADFYSDFVKQNHDDPDYVHASCAAAIIVLADAIERAGTVDKVKVRDALAATNINTFYGPVKFTANGMNQVRDLPIIQVQNKTIKVLNPTDLKNGELHLIKG